MPSLKELQYSALVTWLVLVSCGLEATHAILTRRLLRACPLATTVTCLELMLGGLLATPIHGLSCTLPNALALALWSLARACAADARGFPFPTRVDMFGLASTAEDTFREFREALSAAASKREPPLTRLGATQPSLVDFDRMPAAAVVAALAAFEPVGFVACRGGKTNMAGSAVVISAALWWARSADQYWPVLTLGALAVGALQALASHKAALPAALLLLPYALALDFPLQDPSLNWLLLSAHLAITATAAYLKRDLRHRLATRLTAPHFAAGLHVLSASAVAVALGAVSEL